MDAYTDNKIKTRRLRCWTGRALPYYSSSLLICSSIAAHKNITLHFRSKSRQYGLSGTVSSIDVVAIFTSGQPFGNRAPLSRHHNHVKPEQSLKPSYYRCIVTRLFQHTWPFSLPKLAKFARPKIRAVIWIVRVNRMISFSKWPHSHIWRWAVLPKNIQTKPVTVGTRDDLKFNESQTQSGVRVERSTYRPFDLPCTHLTADSGHNITGDLGQTSPGLSRVWPPPPGTISQWKKTFPAIISWLHRTWWRPNGKLVSQVLLL